MKHSLKSVRTLAATLLTFGSLAGGANGALLSTLYVTDGDISRLAIVNGTVATTATTFSGAYPIAVRDSIWLGAYSGSPINAVEYDLAGNATGNVVSSLAVNGVDGAASATNNYTLGNAFGISATVYIANTDWSGLSAIFDVSGTQLTGITYDSALDNLWISDQNTIYQYSLSGGLISQFSHSSPNRGALAYEAASDTLWYVNTSRNTIDQYSKTGTLLDSVTITNLSSNNWGAEFAAVPEPSSALLIGLGAMGLVARRRRIK